MTIAQQTNATPNIELLSDSTGLHAFKLLVFIGYLLLLFFAWIGAMITSYMDSTPETYHWAILIGCIVSVVLLGLIFLLLKFTSLFKVKKIVVDYTAQELVVQNFFSELTLLRIPFQSICTIESSGKSLYVLHYADITNVKTSVPFNSEEKFSVVFSPKTFSKKLTYPNTTIKRFLAYIEVLKASN